MNAAEIYNIVKDWPKEAWPSDIRYWEMGRQWCTIGECILRPLPGQHGNTSVPLPDCLAELAFEASGMRWLHNRMNAVLWCINDSNEKPYGILAGEGDDEPSLNVDGSTRLAAIDAAIKGLST